MSACAFFAGCLGMCGLLLWLGPRAFGAGLAVYGIGWLIAQEIEAAR